MKRAVEARKEQGCEELRAGPEQLLRWPFMAFFVPSLSVPIFQGLLRRSNSTVLFCFFLFQDGVPLCNPTGLELIV